MISQAKHLKALLKKHGIDNGYGKLSVRTKTVIQKRDRYWDYAYSHCRALTKAEIDALVKDDKYLSIFNIRGKNGFSIIKSSGSEIRDTSWEELKREEEQYNEYLNKIRSDE